jgi:PPP family 3-phenylpropionic acid transporter
MQDDSTNSDSSVKTPLPSAATAVPATAPAAAPNAGAEPAKAVNSAFLRLSTIEFLFWFAAATGTYLTVFLQRQGFQPNQVGLITATNSTVAILATPFWGMMADRIRSIRRIFLFCISVAVVLWALVPAASRITIGPLTLMYLVIPLSAFFRMPANSLMDSFVVQQADLSHVSYGHARLWGSVGWTVMCLILSFVLPRAGVELSFYLYGMAFIPIYTIMFRMKSSDMIVAQHRKHNSFKTMQLGRLFKSYYYITYLIFALFMHMPTSISMTFLPYLVASVGGNTAQLGLVAGYKALLEIPTLLLIKPLRQRFPLPVAIGGAALLYFIEALFYTRASNLLQIIAIQTFHGLGGGLMIGAATNYVYSLAPEGLNSTAHTVHGAVNSFAAIIGSILGGFLIMAVGIRMFYILIAIMLAFALVYFVISLVVGVKVFRIPIPSRRPA